ncbi:phytanoyl-CoA dioxygenase [Paenibacillus sambharensis]|uniref:Phytanoyl-CoA dioxygenase n=1 Tax=Paenibacillus sambharensis TaxID=1803190 RepID=A0A2W1L9F8_9BACL|nr:phytanoyl-CoA dioxygenase family protein [Paenibacillus sambharensis]PZD96838.1 phytanoyl-CoA dioxygenase [Paenibacillus sambharensis]
MKGKSPLHASEASGFYRLTSAQLDTYRTKGQLFLPGVADPAAAAEFRTAVRDAVDKYNTENRPMAERDEIGRAFLQTINLWELSKAVYPFVMCSRYAGIAAQLLETTAVRLYLDQAFFKEPGGGPTPWHRDNDYMLNLAPNRKVTMWMPLTDLTAEIGSLSFLSGSHLLPGSGFKQLIKQSLTVETYGPMTAGDATFHCGYTFHCAPPNPTPHTREAMTITYYPADASITDPGQHPDRLRHMHRYFPGLTPGDHAASLLNPIVYP